MKRLLCAIVAMLLVLSTTAAFATETATTTAAATDYSVAGKLLRQLLAGSGFSGTLTLEVDANEGKLGQGITTQKPLTFQLDYIYVRPSEEQEGEHRADVTLMDGETAQTAAHVQVMDGALSFQADLIGEDWYTAQSVPTITDAQQGDSALSVVDEVQNTVYAQTGMPAIAGFVLPMLAQLENQSAALNTALSTAIDTYTTRVDLWIEGYRQNAVLDKLEDGTTTMTVQYNVPANAVKAQVKQMVLDLLSDAATLSELQDLLSDDDAALLLNPNLQTFYFDAIDALPLSGELSISRTVSLTGDTLALHIALPMYDSQAGSVALRYDRVRGEGDLPDDNTITIESDTRAISLKYLEYRSMTDVTVWQGTLVSEPQGVAGFTVGDEDGDTEEKTIAVAFTLRQQETEHKDEENRDVYDYEATLTLAPDTEATPEAMTFAETEIALKASFVSRELKSAATEMTAELTIGGDEWAQTAKLTMEGRSRRRWDPTPLPEERVNLLAMSTQELESMLPGIVARSGLVLLSYFNLPMDDGATDVPATEPTQTVFETLPPEAETPAP